MYLVSKKCFPSSVRPPMPNLSLSVFRPWLGVSMASRCSTSTRSTSRSTPWRSWSRPRPTTPCVACGPSWRCACAWCWQTPRAARRARRSWSRPRRTVRPSRYPEWFVFSMSDLRERVRAEGGELHGRSAALKLLAGCLETLLLLSCGVQSLSVAIVDCDAPWPLCALTVSDCNSLWTQIITWLNIWWTITVIEQSNTIQSTLEFLVKKYVLTLISLSINFNNKKLKEHERPNQQRGTQSALARL